MNKLTKVFLLLVQAREFFTVCPKLTRPILQIAITSGLFSPHISLNFSYELSKFLVPVLSPFATNDYTVDNFFTFCQKISAVQNANNLSMTSFDVENLFTNISGPLHETITICLDYLFPDGSSNVLGLSRKLFKILLELSVLNLFLLFNSKLFRQT